MKRYAWLPIGLAAVLVPASWFLSTEPVNSLAAEPAPAAQDMKPYTETVSVPGGDIRFDLVPIPGGTFMMGSADNEAGRGDDEGPQHMVEIRPFWMGKFEVTWDEYDVYAFQQDIKRRKEAGITPDKLLDTERNADAVTRPTPPYTDMTFGYGHKGYPALCMMHHAAMEYCRWLSAKTGKTYRLPTEAEWEYACRAGSKTAYSFGDDPKRLDDHAWHVDNADGKPHKVGQKKPNAWGLYDMHGNVAEWCLDHYEKDYTKTMKAGMLTLAPVLLPTDKKFSHVARGGSWVDDPARCRSAARQGSELEWMRQDPNRPRSIWWLTDADFVGFRVVRPLEEQENLKGLKSKVIKG